MMPLARKLPLQLGAIVAAILALFLIVSYLEIRRLSLDASMNRLDRVNQELSVLTQNSQATRREELHRAAQDPAVRAFLRGPGSDSTAARAALDSIEQREGLDAVELWRADGSAVLSTAPASGGHRSAADRFLDDELAVDSAQVGPLYTSEGEIHYWTAAPVLERGRPVGYVALRRQILAQPGAEETFSELLGGPLTLYLSNATDDLWSTLSGKPRTALGAPRDSTGFFEFSDSAGTFIAHRVEVPGLPWGIVSAVPMSWVLERPNAFLRNSTGIALVLILIGAAGAAFAGRSLAGRLRGLALATDQLAAGSYGTRARVDGSDEIGRLGVGFNAMAERIEDAHRELGRQLEEGRVLADELGRSNQAKSQFLATMSHEIRTPINAIVGYADLIDQGISGPVSEKQRENLKRIRRSSEHLMGLVDELLDLAKIEAGKLSPERISADLGEVVEAALSLARPQAAERGITLTAARESPPGVRFVADPMRVRQIVVNLLSNAVKFTQPGRSARVGWGSGEREGRPGRWAWIVVEDEGIGIEAEELERIFEPFVQIDSGYTRASGGTGLGLTISRRLARLMHGDLTVESTFGVGSRFTVWLPARE